MISNKTERDYTVQEIKELFKDHRDQDMDITDKEYDMFCEAIRWLSREIVDRILQEIYFVVISADLDKEDLGYYKNLKSKDLLNKKAIIIINSDFFKFEQMRIRTIFHEVAHHILDHKDVNSSQEREQLEASAKELVNKWYKEKFGI